MENTFVSKKHKDTTPILEKIIENKNWVLLIIVSLVLGGSYAAKNLPVDAVPDVSPIQVLINTKTAGLDPEQVEKTVTYKIESEISGIAGIKEIRSISKFGLSQIITVFEDNTDIYRSRQLISERLPALKEQLPEGLTPELGPISTGLGEVFMYVLTPKSGSLLEKKTELEQLTYLRTINDFIIRPYLKTHIKGIADIDVHGGYKKEIHIDFIPNKMNEYGITLETIISKMKEIGENVGGGYIERNKDQLIIRTQGTVSINDLNNLPIKLNLLGHSICLKNIAIIREGSQQRLGMATYNGNESILGVVLMLSGENSRLVSQQAEESIKSIKLPSDVEIKITYNRKELVNKTLATLAKNLSEGAALVIIVLFFIMGNIRAALVVALGIPFSLFGAFIGMKYFNISANLMSLGAMDFGILIDGSVVIIENLMRHLEEKQVRFITFKEKVKLIVMSVNEVRPSLIMGLFIIMMVYIPILTLEGVEGKMFRPMAITILMALLTSLTVAILFMPVLAYLFIKAPSLKNHHDPLLFRGLKFIYLPILEYSISLKTKLNRIVLLGGAIVLLIVSVVLFSKMGSNFMPPLDEGDMVINLIHRSNISATESLNLQRATDKIILKNKEVRHVYSRVGVSESATDPAGINMSDTFVILHPKKNWPKLSNGKKRTKIELFNQIKNDLIVIMPNSDIANSQPIEMRFNEVLEGSRADISLRIYGKDLKELVRLQNEALSILEKIPGSSAVQLDPLTSLRTNKILNFILDHNKMNLYNLQNSEVSTAMK